MKTLNQLAMGRWFALFAFVPIVVSQLIAAQETIAAGAGVLRAAVHLAAAMSAACVVIGAFRRHRRTKRR